MNSTPEQKPAAGAADIQAWLIDYISAVIDMPREDFPVNDTFVSYGLNSVELTIMCGMLEEAYAVNVMPEELFENPTVTQLATHIAAKLAAGPGAGSAAA